MNNVKDEHNWLVWPYKRGNLLTEQEICMGESVDRQTDRARALTGFSYKKCMGVSPKKWP